MSEPSSSTERPELEHHPISFVGGLLSYLVPGLGQIYQGRFAKGLLFMICLNGMFIYGMKLGHWQNVYLPRTVSEGQTWRVWAFQIPVPAWAVNVYNRPQFAGQFCIGVQAWPSVWQYYYYDANSQNPRGDRLLGQFQRAPRNEEVLNELQRDGDKSWDLGWVYTVIAGVLNVLVIYDAFAGPAFAAVKQKESEPKPKEALAV